MKFKILTIFLLLGFVTYAQNQKSRFANHALKSHSTQFAPKLKFPLTSPMQIVLDDAQQIAYTKSVNLLDVSKIKRASPVALFRRPAGTYMPSFIGNSDPAFLGYSYTFAGFVGSAYSTPWTFKNLTNGATGYRWSWGEIATYSNATDLVLKDDDTNYLSSGMFYAPELKAGNGLDTASYSLGNGGQTEAVLYSSNGIMYLGNADLYGNTSRVDESGMSIASVGALNSTQLNGSGTGYYWGTCLRNQDGLNGTKLKSIISIYEKPMSPLTIKDICYFGYTQKGVTPVPATKKLTATIVKLDNSGNLTTDTIATASIVGADVIVENGENVYLPFSFVEIDPQTGREAPAKIVVNDAFAIVLDGFDDDNMNLGLLSDIDNRIESSSFYTKVDALTGISDGKLYKSATTGMNIHVSMNAYFNYLHVLPLSKLLTVPASGGQAVDANNEAGAVVMSFFYDVQDSVTNEDLIWLKNELPDWLQLEYSNEYYSDYGALLFYFQALPLPANLNERQAEVVLESFGAQASFTIRQLATSSLNATTQALVSLKPNADGYLITYPTYGKNLHLFSLTGQLLASHKLPANGLYQLTTSNLQSGIYVLKIDGVPEAFKILK